MRIDYALLILNLLVDSLAKISQVNRPVTIRALAYESSRSGSRNLMGEDQEAAASRKGQKINPPGVRLCYHAVVALPTGASIVFEV